MGRGGRPRTGGPRTGSRLLIERSLYPDSETEYLPFGAAIIDVDGRRADVEMEFTSKYEWDGAWSPDGTSILVTPDGADGKVVQQQLWDARTGKATPAPWTGTSFPVVATRRSVRPLPGDGPLPSPGLLFHGSPVRPAGRRPRPAVALAIVAV